MKINISDLKQSPIAYTLSMRRPYTVSDISQLIRFLVIFLSGTIGNGMVIQSFIEASERPGSRFVIALAAIDSITSLLSPLQSISIIIYDGYPLGKGGCVVLAPLQLSNTFASAWLLVVISLERARLVYGFLIFFLYIYFQNNSFRLVRQ